MLYNTQTEIVERKRTGRRARAWAHKNVSCTQLFTSASMFDETCTRTYSRATFAARVLVGALGARSV
jgi:hypothetical protein